MLKIIKNITVLFVIIFFGINIIINSNYIMETVSFSIKLWINNIFPSLFPFFILSDFLINYGFVEFVSELMKPIMIKIFKINPNCSFILIMSLLSGFPSSAKYTRELYLKKIIDEEEATKILTFTHFSNPLFIIGTINSFIYNKKATLLILIIHYLTNLIIGLIFRNYNNKKYIKTKISLKKMLNNRTNSKSFGLILSESIKDTISTLLLILGTITIFLIISNILIDFFNLNIYFETLLKSIFEMTQGIQNISNLNVDLKIKSTIIGMILSFGGLSIHMQVKSIISDTNIKYLPYFTARLLHSGLTGIFIFLFFELI